MLDSKLFFEHENMDLDSLVTAYDTTLTSILDKHAPIVSRTVRYDRRGPWYNDEVHTVRRKAPAYERMYRKKPSPALKTKYRKHENIYLNVLDKAKTMYYRNVIENNAGDQKRLFRTINSVMHRERQHPIPIQSNPKELANDFNSFFANKVDKIRKDFSANNEDTFS